VGRNLLGLEEMCNMQILRLESKCNICKLKDLGSNKLGLGY
jgi:hypothetical protein